MREWMDLNGDSEIDAFEQMIKDEMLCTEILMTIVMRMMISREVQ